MSYHAVLTLVFFGAFLIMACWVYRPGRKQHYQSLAQQAVDDDAARGAQR
ncbi:cbb3-type cytochrome c oxidase subunit CcoQ [Alcanivorax sp. S71-1-4]|jgi:cytochrome c oxidase cbb3-type subunit IV|nr:CcoQ/FixQ family Cbb3-type cytochrome c oxidase assembly chaperone [Alcanivorax sp. S71-1-4]KAF0805520.1 cbb3-type cytochrome c oxidase subunit CcoQ [Alcanivorax sp. S71-1-4]